MTNLSFMAMGEAAWLHSDLLQALNGEHLTVPGFQLWEPEFLSQYAREKNDHN